jgi:hypothetical protein
VKTLVKDAIKNKYMKIVVNSKNEIQGLISSLFDSSLLQKFFPDWRAFEVYPMGEYYHSFKRKDGVWELESITEQDPHKLFTIKGRLGLTPESFVCEKCGNASIEGKCWGEINETGDRPDFEGDDLFWCAECDDHVEGETISEYLDKKIENEYREI